MASKVLPPIPHLAGRPKALALLGWTGAAAEWLALVCLHSGVFTRAQYCHRFDVGPWGAHRFVRRPRPLPRASAPRPPDDRAGVPRLRTSPVPGPRSRAHSPSAARHRGRRFPEAPLPRFRGGASRSPLARHRAGEGGPLRGARDQACYPPAARLRRSRGALSNPGRGGPQPATRLRSRTSLPFDPKTTP